MIAKILSIFMYMWIGSAISGPLDETRYCEIVPHRDSDGSISRRADVLITFRRIHVCPSTGKTKGPCPRWQIDHVIPLACGGCDAVSNLQWLPVAIKTCTSAGCKDRWERKIYCNTVRYLPLGAP